jgi:HTH-type transcriptional regulator/antitoxin MqsA
MLRRAIRTSEIEGELTMAAKCPVCGGAEEATRIAFTATIEGSLLTIEEVPALVCRQCGEETFSADTMKRIEALLAAQPRPARVAEVPVYVLGAA